MYDDNVALDRFGSSTTTLARKRSLVERRFVDCVAAHLFLKALSADADALCGLDDAPAVTVELLDQKRALLLAHVHREVNPNVFVARAVLDQRHVLEQMPAVNDSRPSN